MKGLNNSSRYSAHSTQNHVQGAAEIIEVSHRGREKMMEKGRKKWVRRYFSSHVKADGGWRKQTGFSRWQELRRRRLSHPPCCDCDGKNRLLVQGLLGDSKELGSAPRTPPGLQSLSNTTSQPKQQCSKLGALKMMYFPESLWLLRILESYF